MSESEIGRIMQALGGLTESIEGTDTGLKAVVRQLGERMGRVEIGVSQLKVAVHDFRTRPLTCPEHDRVMARLAAEESETTETGIDLGRGLVKATGKLGVLLATLLGLAVLALAGRATISQVVTAAVRAEVGRMATP